MIAKIRNIDGDVIQMNIPYDSIKLADGLAFDIHVKNIDYWLTKEIKASTIETSNNYYLYLVAKALHEYTGTDLNDLLSWSIEDLIDEDGNLYPNILQEHLKPTFVDKTDDSVESTITTIFNAIRQKLRVDDIKLVANKSLGFIHNGIEYEVPYMMKSLFGKKVFSKISIGRSVDILKIKNYIANFHKGYVEDLSKVKNKTFSCFLQIISILAIEKGQEYPDSPEAAKAFVAENMVKFQDIDYHTAHRVIFFLTRILMS